MRPTEVVRRGSGYLERHGVEAPDVNAEALMMRLLDVDRAALYAREQGLSSAEARAYGRALCLRCAGTPLQHLTGEQGFRHLVLTVRPDVFVPRPETEVLVDVALELLEGTETPCVVDLCTGSGAVALAIADERPGARVMATDISEAAVALAHENAEHLGLAIDVRAGDLFEPLAAARRGEVDLIVANPPYLSIEVAGDLPPEVRADPPEALFGGLKVTRRLITEAIAWLRPGGALAIECDEGDAAAVAAAARDAGFEEVFVRRDLNGRDRVVGARRP
ncbi:MAG: peptide chain release factor N(5)-glutamine methyltransferase [Actinomycetota bacterium]|nr:peptide chain release factor N(5)-glutamine methyltransferase [Actinomycetota bacterium]